MCSIVCPCDPGQNNETKNYYENLGSKKLLKFGRVAHFDEMTEEQKEKYIKEGVASKIVPLEWSTNSMNQFSSFEKCYDDKM